MAAPPARPSGAGALIVPTDPLFIGRREQIVALAIHHAIPTIFAERESVAAGGLMSFVPNAQIALSEKTHLCVALPCFTQRRMVKDTSITGKKRNRMKKFLVLYRMDMAEMQKMMASTSAEERKKSMGE